MTQNTVPPSPKFTLKSKDLANLPEGLTSVYRSFKEPKVRSWIKRRTRGLAAHPWDRHCRLKVQNQMARIPKKLAHIRCPILKLTGNEDDFLKQGREIYGFIQWTAVLRELNYKFQEDSTVDSIKKKAELKMPRADQSNSECTKKWSLLCNYFRRLQFNVSREVKSSSRANNCSI